MLSALVLGTAISVLCECGTAEARTYEAARIRVGSQCSVRVVGSLEADPLDCTGDGAVDVADVLCFNRAIQARIFETTPPEEAP